MSEKEPYWLNPARLVGPPWPLLSEAERDGPRAEGVLVELWEQVLRNLDPRILSPETAALLRARESAPRAGFEITPRARELDPAAFWFFDLGVAAMGIVAGRSWQATGRPASGQRLIEAWRRGGFDAALSIPGESPWHFQVKSIAAYLAGEAREAIALMDRSLDGLRIAEARGMGITPYIFYALLDTHLGRTAHARERLQRALEEDRWSPAEQAELTYHLLRVELVSGEGFADRLADLARADSAYILRLAADPVLFRRAGEWLSAEADRLRGRLIRWRRRITSTTGADTPFSGTIQLLQHAGETYPLFAAEALRLRAIEGGAVEPYIAPVDVEVHWRAIEQEAAHFPLSMPLRLEAGLPRMFGDRDHSLFGMISAAIAGRGLEEDIVAYIDLVHRTLVEATRVAIFEHAERLGDALQSARARADREAKQDQAEEITAWARRLLEVTNEVGQMPDHPGTAHAQATKLIWDSLQRIEGEWRRSLASRTGSVSLVAPDRVEIERGGWRAIEVEARDAAGRPAAGVPISWQVVSGPAAPRDGLICLADAWAETLNTGVAYLPVHVPAEAREGEEGVLRMEAAGAADARLIHYRIGNANRKGK